MLYGGQGFIYKEAAEISSTTATAAAAGSGKQVIDYMSANASNSIYKDGLSVVQPKALNTNYIIKY